MEFTSFYDYSGGAAPTKPAKPVSCPVVRVKKEPGERDRDVNGLLDRKFYNL